MINIDTTQADRVIERQAQLLSSQELARAGASAVNRASRAAATAMNRAIRQELAIRAGDVRERIKVSRATPGKVESTITVDRRPLPLSHYQGMRQTNRGVSVRIKRGGGLVRIPGAFIVEAYQGEAFLRAGPERGPVGMLFGPSIGSQADAAWKDAERRGVEVLNDRLSREVRRRFELANR